MVIEHVWLNLGFILFMFLGFFLRDILYWYDKKLHRKKVGPADVVSIDIEIHTNKKQIIKELEEVTEKIKSIQDLRNNIGES